MPTLTVYVADPGTPLNSGSPSEFGHMWYSISNSGPPLYFGFEPITPGQAFDQGHVVFDDNQVYETTSYSQSVQITSTEYNNLLNFGTNPTAYGFGTYYNGLGNNCTNFVWDALNTIGIQNPGSFSIDPDDSGYEYAIPMYQIGALQQALGAFQQNPSQQDENDNETTNSYASNGTLDSTTVTDSNGNLVSQTVYQYSPDGTSTTGITTDSMGQVTQVVAGSIDAATASVVADTTQINYGSGSTNVSINNVDNSAPMSFTMLGTPTVQVAPNGGSASAGDASSVLLIGVGGSTLTGGRGQNLLLGFGNNDTVNGGSGTNQIVVDGLGETINASGATIGNLGNSGLNLSGNDNTVNLNTNDSLVDRI